LPVRIQNGIVRSDLRLSEYFSEVTGCELHLKCELYQRTGSFKERGARNRLLRLSEEEKKRGVVAASAGNHALALARHGKLLQIPATVVMPTNAPITKISNCERLGANVILHGEHLAEARKKATEMRDSEGLIYVNGFDDPDIIAGAGTIGLEIMEQLREVDAVVVPCGGGGLIAGIALAVKSLHPTVLVYGVEAEACPSMTKALEAGTPTAVNVKPSLADGLGVQTVGANAFEIVKSRLDRLVTVTEKEIALAVLKLCEVEKCVVEGAGATGVAAILAGKFPELQGKRVVTPLCGGNIDPGVLGTVIQRGMAADGRLMKFEASICDRPGGLAAFAALVAKLGGSVKDIQVISPGTSVLT